MRWAATGRSAADLTAIAELRPFLAAALAEGSARPVLLVTSTYREAEQLAGSLESLLEPDQVAFYPAWETLPHERLSPRSDTVGRRLAVLRRLVGNDELPPPRVLLAPVRSILQPQVAGLGQMSPVRLRVGDDYDIQRLARDLVAAAYIRTDLVTQRGEFSVRGGIVDLFPPTDEAPVRIDFFGDQVEEIRAFAVADQRSTDQTRDQVLASPCRELLLTDQVKERARQLMAAHPELSDMLERIAAGHAVEGMEALAPALVDGLELLTDVVPDDTLVLVADPELVRQRAKDLQATSQEFLQASWAAAAGGGQAPIDLGASAYQSLAEVRRQALSRGLAWWSLSSFAVDQPSQPELARAGGEPVPSSAGPGSSATAAGSVGSGSSRAVSAATGPDSDWSQGMARAAESGVESITVEAWPTESWRGRTEQAVEDLTGRLAAGQTVVVAAEGRGLATRYRELLTEAGLPTDFVERLDRVPQPGRATVTLGQFRHGFFLPELDLLLVTTADLAGQSAPDKSARRLPSRRKNQIDPLELAAGDLIVHDQHGVGRYVELTQRQVAGAVRDYLVIEYAASKRGQPGDRLYLPMDQLHLVTRYVGGEQPSLDRLGSADWSKRKARARKAVRQIAQELIQLYAARQSAQGFAFSPDGDWQREMEDSFSHIETPDQLSCIEEVKRDMERVTPMDRLICGDVGYGKTEIAVRAAFKAVQDGKQVAVLVPTTLLAQQHLATFAGRFAGFPVTVAPLSRFQTAAEERQTVAGLKTGQVDVVIGTHRLLSGDVEFHDLGLVVIDEEQRFGVEHKETLKKLRLDVDVLAMSATPIPRTLEMAITGIRELSVIATPPEERHPVLTFAGVYDEGQVRAAIRRELAREGQVFFIHNRVDSIARVAARLSELVPEAKVAVAHGKMGERALAQVMVDFWERRADLLVCTTIVESGLDIQTANTLIVDRADAMGLSQLHQLRGRVGRGRDRGYAYFFYPVGHDLSQTAHDRLATMAAHAELGAGLSIAMKDLEIRGAGNLLGADQSGHIEEVGFDLYLRLVGEAVEEFRGQRAEPEPQMRIELPVEAHLPDDYIGSERLRLEMYKRIAQVQRESDLAGVIDELTDRYGPPPAAALALIEVAAFRLAARRAGLVEVVAQGKFVRFEPAELPESRQLRLRRLYPGSVYKAAQGQILAPRPETGALPRTPVVGPDLLRWAGQLVQAIFPPDPAADPG
ncbi:MAG: transcription-repair coupling factor [Propionibacteriaceae bacterium]|nr:transcription-repair coupling factor [Propionibacteriaceae bacterium]